MSEELEVLKIVTQRLNQSNIVYMISGSIAANYYTVPRMTRDIDIVIELTKADTSKFVALFQDDFYMDEKAIEKEVSRHGIFNLIHNQYVIKIDFIIRKESEFQDSVFSRRKKVQVENSPMWFVSAEDLILVKLLWAKDSYSEVQLKDVQNLIKTVNDLDLEHIKKWVLRLGLEQVYREV
ncbi:MAG: hypothetical protein P9M13_05755 [Candidatus Ancaeobacter aquaticus]|nr:hypothetical protein [Candidatus Ancaeobacter aquaticus]